MNPYRLYVLEMHLMLTTQPVSRRAMSAVLRAIFCQHVVYMCPHTPTLADHDPIQCKPLTAQITNKELLNQLEVQVLIISHHHLYKPTLASIGTQTQVPHLI